MILTYGKSSTQYWDKPRIMSKVRSAAIVTLLLAVIFPLAAENRVVNPVPGTWANRQALVLSLDPENEAFYSINGADPSVSGFAYDGPVMIDVTGNVEIRIAFSSPDGTRKEQSVVYTVKEAGSGSSEDIVVFLKECSAEPVFSYVPGSSIRIPSSLKYAVGTGNIVFMPGTSISCSAESKYARYAPLTLTDGTSYWRYVISPDILPGQVSQRDVPFRIADWNTVTFTDRKYIYSVDGGIWQAGGTSAVLDRSQPHELRWQSVSYASGNPVQTFSLPPEPELQSSVLNNGAVHFSLSGDPSYRIAGKSGSIAPGLFSGFTLDVLQGDMVSDTIPVDIYSDSVYQGTLAARVFIDKRPPENPVLVSSSKTFLARSAVTVSVSAEKNAKVYYAQSVPKTFSGRDETVLFSTVPVGPYNELSGSKIILSSNSEDAVFLKVSVYAQDVSGNKSLPAEYSVIIDRCNYYFDASADKTVQDGSRDHPYTSLEPVMSLLTVPSESRFIHLHIRGTQEVPSGSAVIQNNCVIEGTDNAALLFPPEASFMLQTVSMSIKNCIVSRKPAEMEKEKQNVHMFVLQNSVADFDSCEIIGTFGSSGTVISGSSSVVYVKNTSIISQAEIYSAAVSFDNSRVSIQKSRISAIAPTSVAFSLRGGHLEVRSSDCKVIGNMGRIAELLGAECFFSGNTFTGELDGKAHSDAIWKDSKVKTLEETGNTVIGF